MRRRVKKTRRWAVLPIVVLAVVIVLAAVVGIQLLIDTFMLPEDYLFYEMTPLASIAMIWVLMIPIILVLSFIAMKVQKKSMEEMEEVSDILTLWNIIGTKKGRAIAAVVWIVILYACITSMNVVTKDQIICFSPIHPNGITYSYSDVEEIKTGFGEKTLTIFEYEKVGSFYYQVTVDGRKCVFHTPSINEEIERYEDSYLELEEFDQRLMVYGIPKTGKKDGYENCSFDQVYVDRFVRITENR